MMEWKKHIRDSIDIKEGYGLCPECLEDTIEELVVGEQVLAERCSNGCYEHSMS